MSCQGETKKKRVNWSWAEEKAMLTIFHEKNIHVKLDGREVRSDECYHEVSEAMAQKGYERNPTQVRIKYYALRSTFRDLKKSQSTSGAGFETIAHGALLFELFGNRPAARLVETGVDSSRNATTVYVADENGESEVADFQQIDDPDDDLIALADLQEMHNPEEVVQPIQPPEEATLKAVRNQPEFVRSAIVQIRQESAEPSRSSSQSAQPNIQRRQENERDQPLARGEAVQKRQRQELEQQPNPRRQNDRPELEDAGLQPVRLVNVREANRPVNQQVRREARQDVGNGQGVVAGDIAVEADGIAVRQAPGPRPQDAHHGVRRGAGRVQGVLDRTKGKGSYAKALSTFHEQWSRSQRELQEDMLQRNESFMIRELEASRRWEEEQQILHQRHTRELIESSNVALTSSIDKMMAAFNKPLEQSQIIPHIPDPVSYPQGHQYSYPMHISRRNSSPNSVYSASFTDDQIPHSQESLSPNTTPRVIPSTITSPNTILPFHTTYDHCSARNGSENA